MHEYWGDQRNTQTGGDKQNIQTWEEEKGEQTKHK